jgi:UDP-N-acetylglucosamine transferase subunit ALG13
MSDEPTRARPVVLFVAGTDIHPFTRFVDWADRLAVDLAGQADVIVQHGHTAPPSVATGHEFLVHDELVRLLGVASVAVTHGGPGTIMGARDAGLRPIVVPRDPALGEHVDDHQQRFAALLAREGRVDLARDEDDLDRLVTLALATGGRSGAPVVAEPAAGVAAAGRVLDELLAQRRSRRSHR